MTTDDWTPSTTRVLSLEREHVSFSSRSLPAGRSQGVVPGLLQHLADYGRSGMLPVVGTLTAASLLRQARTASGLSQSELARKAGVTQSVISVYEAGRRQPSVPTLAALIAATGYELDLSLGRPRRGMQRLTGPVGRRLRGRRSEVVAVAARHGVQVLGVFGSVARGEDRPDSDIDLLVQLPAGMGLFALASVQNELEELLGAEVDLIPEAGLKAGVRPSVEADLVPL